MVVPALKILAEVDLADAEPAGKRRPDDLLLDQRLLRGHLGARGLQGRHVGVERRLADRLGRELLLIALEGLLGELRGRLELLQFGEVVVRLAAAAAPCPPGTSLPESNSISSTTPEACAERSAPRTARSVPTAWICACHVVAAAVTVETVCGALAARAMNFLVIEPMNACQPKIPPKTMATSRTMMIERLDHRVNGQRACLARLLRVSWCSRGSFR